MVVTWAYNAVTNTATASGAGSTNFAALVAADTAGGWGKFTADTTGIQIKCAGKITIGDATNACVFTDTNKQIIFSTGIPSGTGQNLIWVQSNATLNLGTLVNATNKSTSSGCTITMLEATYDTYLIYQRRTGSNFVNLYGCTFASATAKVARISLYTTSKVYDCTFSNNSWLFSLGGTCTVNNILISNSGLANTDGIELGSGTFNRVNIQDTTWPFVTWTTNGITVSNCLLRGCTYILFMQSCTVDSYLINVDSDVWTFQQTGGAANTGKVYRQYEFDLTTDTSATVTLKNNAGTTVFSVTSDALTGAIATQIVSRGYYNQTNGNTLQDYGPFTLTITKTGKMPYTQTGIVLSQKTSWQIQLRDQLSGTAAVGDVAATKTFYKDNTDSKLTGTLTLTGSASEADVVQDKTFYGTDPKVKRTGTFNPIAGGGPATVTVVEADPEEVIFVDGKPALLIDEKDPEIYTFINKKSERVFTKKR